MTLEFAFADFLSFCQYEKSLSPKTLKAYRIDLNQFAKSLGELKNITDVSKKELREYLTFLSELKPKSIKRKVATLKALFNYLEFEDKISVSPLRKMKIRIREPKVLCRTMNLHEVKKLFRVGYKKMNAAISNHHHLFFESVRNVAVLELLFATGGRVSEIANLKKENINLQTGNVIIKGKGNKERIIQICNKESLTVLRDYQTLFKSKIAREGWFLINRNYNKLSDQSIRNIVRMFCKKAGIIKNITPHMFRHTFGTMLLERGVDIRYIQSLLGHSSITTTQMYTHVNAKKQRQILLAKHPRKDFTTDESHPYYAG